VCVRAVHWCVSAVRVRVQCRACACVPVYGVCAVCACAWMCAWRVCLCMACVQCVPVHGCVHGVCAVHGMCVCAGVPVWCACIFSFSISTSNDLDEHTSPSN
jgi:hypothetical protein